MCIAIMFCKLMDKKCKKQENDAKNYAGVFFLGYKSVKTVFNGKKNIGF